MKKLIKIISLIIALLLVFSVVAIFVSCGNKKAISLDEISKPIPDDIKREIQVASLKSASYGENYEKFGYTPEQVKVVCFGVFNDIYCVMTWNPDVIYLDIETDISSGGYWFEYNTTNTIRVYYGNGHFMSLSTAYVSQKLSEDQIEEVYDYYNEFRDSVVTPDEYRKGAPSIEEIEEIQKAYCEKNYGKKYKAYRELKFDYYGKYDNAHCLIFYPKDMYATSMTYMDVGGYTFAFGSNTMSVYCEGEFYGLKQAYENGILDDSELAELYANYNRLKWGK